MSRMTRQTLQDMHQMMYAYTNFTQYESTPMVWVTVQVTVMALLASLALCAPTWYADYKRNPFSWRIDWNVFGWLMVAFFVGFFIIVLIKTPTDPFAQQDIEFRRHRAMKKVYDKFPKARKDAIIDAIDAVDELNLTQLDTINEKQLDAIRTVVVWARQKG